MYVISQFSHCLVRLARLLKDFDTGVLIDFTFEVKDCLVKMIKLIGKWKEVKEGPRSPKVGATELMKLLPLCEKGGVDNEAAVATTAAVKVSVSLIFQHLPIYFA